MNAPLAIFRCDASPTIGAGHVSRCLGVAEAFLDAGWRAVFAVGLQTSSTITAFKHSRIEWHEIPASKIDDPQTLRNIAGGRAEVLIMDHSNYGRSFEQECAAWVDRILAFDDNSGREHECDVLIDAAALNVGSYASRVPTKARILTGPKYATLRRGFIAGRAAALARRHGRSVASILVSFGAADYLNLTAAVLDALSDNGNQITVVMSSQAPHLASVRDRAGGSVHLAIDVQDMAALVANADIGIGSPGVSAYERAALGLPSILLTIADNQRGVCRMMVDAGAALDGGEINAALPVRLRRTVEDLIKQQATRERMSEAAAALVDGRGPMRIFVESTGEIVTNKGIRVHLRLAELSDEQWILQLQSEPETRRFARDPKVPSADEHHRWIAQMLKCESSLLAVIVADGQAAGTVRIDRHADLMAMPRYEVSIAIISALHGQGIGSAVLSLVRRLQPGAVLDAFILPENTTSMHLFARANYSHVGNNLYRSLPA